MNLVLDASLVWKMVFPETHTETVSDLVADAGRLQWRLVAPAFMWAGMTNVIRRRMRTGDLTLDQALTRVEALLALPFDVVDSPSLYPVALRLAGAFSLSTYDALYIALAQSLGCDLWTDDQRVLRALAGRLSFVRWIGEYTALP